MSNFSMEELNKITERGVADRHSLFQLKYFVVGKEPTVQAQLWRCVRELQARKDTIAAINLEMAEVADDTELLDIDIEKLKENKISEPEEEKKRAAITLRKLTRRREAYVAKAEALKRKLAAVQEEAQFFINVFNAIEKAGETLKPFDDPKSQFEYWNEKLSQELNMRLLLHSPVDLELLRSILVLDDKTPVKAATVKWLEGYKGVQRKLAEPKTQPELEQAKQG